MTDPRCDATAQVKCHKERGHDGDHYSDTCDEEWNDPTPGAAVDPREANLRRLCAALLQTSNRLVQMAKRSQFSSHPVDMTGVLVESLAVLMQSQAFLVDAVLMGSGTPAELKFEEVAKVPGNGGSKLEVVS